MDAKKIIIACAVGLTTSIATSHAQMSDAGDPTEFAEDLKRGETPNTDGEINDPWEGFNRAMFALNGVIDGGILVPSAKVYRSLTHKKQRKGLRNLLANARTPVILINDLLRDRVIL